MVETREDVRRRGDATHHILRKVYTLNELNSTCIIYILNIFIIYLDLYYIQHTLLKNILLHDLSLQAASLVRVEDVQGVP